MVLGKLPVPGRPTILITVGQRPIALAVGAGGGLFEHIHSPLSFLSSFSLSLGDCPIETKILSQRAVKPKTTNQPVRSVACKNYNSACLHLLVMSPDPYFYFISGA